MNSSLFQMSTTSLFMSSSNTVHFHLLELIRLGYDLLESFMVLYFYLSIASCISVRLGSRIPDSAVNVSLPSRLELKHLINYYRTVPIYLTWKLCLLQLYHHFSLSRNREIDSPSWIPLQPCNYPDFLPFFSSVLAFKFM